MSGLLKEVRSHGDLFTHDVLYEILLRYADAIVDLKHEDEHLAYKILQLAIELDELKTSNKRNVKKKIKEN